MYEDVPSLLYYTEFWCTHKFIYLWVITCMKMYYLYCITQSFGVHINSYIYGLLHVWRCTISTVLHRVLVYTYIHISMGYYMYEDVLSLLYYTEFWCTHKFIYNVSMGYYMYEDILSLLYYTEFWCTHKFIYLWVITCMKMYHLYCITQSFGVHINSYIYGLLHVWRCTISTVLHRVLVYT